MAKGSELSGTIQSDARNAKLEAEKKKLERTVAEADAVYRGFVES